MSNVLATARVAVDAESLWRKIGGFGAVGDWHPMLSSVESEGDMIGSTRTAHGKDGSKQVERLLDIDDAGRVYRYKMESTAMPVRDYTAEFRIDDNDDGTSTVNWSAQFATTENENGDAEKMVSDFLEAGTDNLEKLYGKVA